jgi:OmpA-OmpF porin, OOP family
MRKPGGRVQRAVQVFLLVIVAPATASAQEIPYDPNVDAQLFEYQIGPKSFFAVDDATIAADQQLALDFMLTFLRNPVKVYNVADDSDVITGDRTFIVKNMLAGEVSGAYGLKGRFQLGLALPLVLSMSGDGLDPATAMGSADGLQITGLGDLRGEVKARIWEQDQMRLSGAAGLTLPSSFGAGGDDYLGDDLPSLRGRVAFHWGSTDGRIDAGANLGLILRKPRTIYASEIGPQFTWGLAGAYRFTDKFSVIAETFGRSGMTSITDVDSTPMEIGAGMRVIATRAIAVTLGGSGGVFNGIGTPDMRVFASVGYAPDSRDSDGDGIPNSRDRCPLVPEDRDGFQDGDGCPDDDNDGDLRPDAEDQCPNEAEDIDGFEDDDGCPEYDNDGDGIPDLEDRFCPFDKEDGLQPQPSDGCPVHLRDTDGDGIYDHLDACFDRAEDLDGFEDWDGCPEYDNDGDGIPDDVDRCPLCAEDIDGFEDDDGCPEPDNDRDGFPDLKDACPNEPETLNGIDDWDGCPDDGGAVVAEFEGDRITFKAPVAFDRKGLTRAGQVVLDQAALLMFQHPEITRWAIAVAAKKDADAKKRGAWVIKHLASRGIDPSRIDLLTSKGTPAVGIAVMERIERDEGGFCPAGSEVVPRRPPEPQ